MQLFETYIPLRCSYDRTLPGLLYLETEVDNWLGTPDRPVLAIFSEGGTGKSTFCANYADKMTKKLDESWRVLLFTLSSLVDHSKLLAEASLRRNNLLILDAYDEIPNGLTPNLWITNNLGGLNLNFKVLITSRTGHLPPDAVFNQYADYFAAPDFQFFPLYISPMNNDEIALYSKRFYMLNKTELISLIPGNDKSDRGFMFLLKTIPKLKQLMITPMMCFVCLYALPSILMSEKITTSSIYDAFLRTYIEKKNSLQIDECFEYGRELAYKMLRRIQMPVNNLTRMLPIGADGKFLHLSIRDYFLSEFFHHNLEELENVLLYPHHAQVTQFLADHVKGPQKLDLGNPNHFSLFRLLKNGKNFAAANAITIFNAAGVQLNNVDLSNLNLEYANLSGGFFERSNFNGSNLARADLRGASIADSSFIGCNLADAKFDHKPYSEITDSIRKMDFYNGDLIARTALDELIRLTINEGKINRNPDSRMSIDDFSCQSSGMFVYIESQQTLTISTPTTVSQYQSSNLILKRAVLVGNLVVVVSSTDTNDSIETVDSDGKLVLGRIDLLGRIGCMVAIDETSILIGYGGELLIYSISTGKLKALPTGVPKNGKAFYCVVSANSGEYLAGSKNDGTIVLIRNREHIVVSTAPSDVEDMHFITKDGKTVALATCSLNTRSISLWGINGHFSIYEELNGHQVEVTALTSNGQILYSADSGGTIRMWDIHHRPKLRPCTGPNSQIQTVAISPDSKYIAAGTQTELFLWDENGQEIKYLTGDCIFASLLHFSGNSETLAVVGNVKKVTVYSIPEMTLLSSHIITDLALCVAFSPSNYDLIAFAGFDHKLTLWNSRTDHQEIFDKEISVINCLSFSEQGKFIATGTQLNGIRIWEVASRLMKYSINTAAPVWSISFCGDSIVFYGEGNRHGDFSNAIKSWDMQNPGAIKTLIEIADASPVGGIQLYHTGKTTFIAFHLAQKPHERGSTKIYTLTFEDEQTKKLTVYESHRHVVSISLDRDKTSIAVASERSIRLLDIDETIHLRWAATNESFGCDTGIIQ